MPRLSDTMEEGTLAKWFKKVGDDVKEGEILAEIETDKATMEFESFHDGVLLHIGIDEGSTAPVDSIIAGLFNFFRTSQFRIFSLKYSKTSLMGLPVFITKSGAIPSLKRYSLAIEL